MHSPMPGGDESVYVKSLPAFIDPRHLDSGCYASEEYEAEKLCLYPGKYTGMYRNSVAVGHDKK